MYQSTLMINCRNKFKYNKKNYLSFMQTNFQNDLMKASIHKQENHSAKFVA